MGDRRLHCQVEQRRSPEEVRQRYAYLAGLLQEKVWQGLAQGPEGQAVLRLCGRSGSRALFGIGHQLRAPHPWRSEASCFQECCQVLEGSWHRFVRATGRHMSDLLKLGFRVLFLKLVSSAVVAQLLRLVGSRSVHGLFERETGFGVRTS